MTENSWSGTIASPQQKLGKLHFFLESSPSVAIKYKKGRQYIYKIYIKVILLFYLFSQNKDNGTRN